MSPFLKNTHDTNNVDFNTMSEDQLKDIAKLMGTSVNNMRIVYRNINFDD